MELAGRGCAQACLDLLARRGRAVAGATVAVVAGAGNNGGDGYVVARHLANAGADVTTYLLSPKEKLKGDALINFKILEKMGGAFVDLSAPGAVLAKLEEIARADLLVDAIFGTGLTNAVKPAMAEAIRALDGLACPRVGVDIPSGVDSDTGAVLGAA